MVYENDHIVEASVTKSRPGQKIGLGLEEKNCDKSSIGDDEDNINCSRSTIFVVTEIGGLFKKKNLPVHAGDELLEVNGIPVTNEGQFPNGLKDIRKFLRGAWSIRVKVGRNYNSDGGETSTTETTEKSYFEFDQQPEDDSGHRRDETVEAHAAVNHEPSDAPVLAKRRGRRKNKETLGTLIRNARSQTPSSSRRGTRRGKRKTKVSEAGSGHSRSASNRNVETRETEAGSGHSRSRSNRMMETRETEAGSGHSRSTSNRKIELRVAEVDSGHSRSTSNRKLEIRKAEVGSGHSRSTSNRKMETRETPCTISGVTLEMNDGNHVSVSSETKEDENKIRGVRCTDSGVTLEMKDGNRVSVNPEELMALVSEENGKFVAVSKRTLNNDRPTLQRTKCERQLAISDSDDDSISKDKPMEVPTLQDLRNLFKKKNSSWNNDENTPILPDVRNLLESAPDDVSIENLMKQNPWAKTSLMNILEEHNIDSMRNVAANAQEHQQTAASLSLRNLLGERLQTTNPKKWEESSMVSSTLACMTNLIDPGDLMKIRNFASRPRLNGATVEIVKKSEAMYGYDSNRWDVRVIQRKHKSLSDAFQDPNRFISVAADNLKHFV